MPNSKLWVVGLAFATDFNCSHSCLKFKRILSYLTLELATNKIFSWLALPANLIPSKSLTFSLIGKRIINLFEFKIRFDFGIANAKCFSRISPKTINSLISRVLQRKAINFVSAWISKSQKCADFGLGQIQ